MSSFSRQCQTGHWGGYRNLYFYQQCMESLMAPHLQHLSMPVFEILACLDWGVMVAHCGFPLHLADYWWS